ncbi:hypothetical protein LPJ64_000459 [Coemansia asiatica]|uniref:Altered inheritance of mitochondria protein 24, mitochondrial n=1 Tax=Coemansia asiatica TaxID=1052880 RepID=A0A9W7XQ98_9FUNG|nr:hypothetical protein LPJ64_000459 [Coemansia asiatica]
MTAAFVRQANSLLLKATKKAFQHTQKKRAVSVFLNDNHEKQQQASSTDQPESKVGRSLSSIFQNSQPPAPADPHFTVISSGFGSLVMAKMPPHSQFFTRVGLTLGQSPSARSKAVTTGPTAPLRSLLGRQIFMQEITTDSKSADILLAPKMPGDVAVVGINGSVEFYVRKSCLVARTKFLQVSTWNAIGAKFHALAFDRVAGRGSMVLNTHGGLHRLVLNQDEVYLVDPRYVVAWSSNLKVCPQSGRPKPLAPDHTMSSTSNSNSPNNGSKPDAVASPQVAPLMSNTPTVENKISWPAPSPTKPTQTVKQTTAAASSDAKNKASGNSSDKKSNIFSVFAVRMLDLVKRSTRSALYASANALRNGGWAAAKTTRTLAGVPDLYRVTGPGEIFVSTRLAPKPWTRITNAISARSSVSE